MRRSRAAALATLAVLFASSARAAAQSPAPAPETIAVGDWLLAPTLQVRTRGEYWRDPVDVGGGVDVSGNVGQRVRNAGGFFERSRLGVLADRGPLRLQLTLQDARAWGSPSPTATLGGSDGLAQLGAYEAYLEAHSSSARPAYLRVGRQAVVWGDGRLLGNADWSPTARTLDAARAHLALGNFDFEILAAMLASSRPLGTAWSDTSAPARGGAQLYAAQIAWTLDPLLVVQAFAFAKVARTGTGGFDPARGFNASRAEGETYTGALRIGGESKGWRYALEGAYQIGSASTIGAPGGVDRQAFAAAALVEKKLDRILAAPIVRIGGAYATGDDGSGSYKQFDPLLPDVHAFHGAMDVFAWSNVIEGDARVTIAPWSDSRFGVEYRYARMAESKGEWLNAYLVGVGRARAAGASDSAELGHELDAFVTWTPWAPLDVHFGYSALLLGDGAKAILAAQGRGAQASSGLAPASGGFTPSDVAHYGYLQATLRVP